MLFLGERHLISVLIHKPLWMSSSDKFRRSKITTSSSSDISVVDFIATSIIKSIKGAKLMVNNLNYFGDPAWYHSFNKNSKALTDCGY